MGCDFIATVIAWQCAHHLSPRLKSSLLFACALLMLLCWPSSKAQAQQPFYTDDADVTNKGKLHFQFGNEYDLLQRLSYPAKTQNTAVFELDYGLFKGVEIGVDAPLLAIHSARFIHPRTAVGIGDVNFHLKYNFYKERESSRLPAMAVNMNIELPTGDASKQLGSSFTDYFLNGILQKSLTAKTKLRVNGGILFAGNTTTGVIGIKARGRVYTAGGSLVKQLTKRLDFGAEITGAVTNNFQLSKGQLQTLVGGNYALRKNLTLDFGIVAGRFTASPRVGAQLGISMDF
jgi:hypothetical protein